METSADINIPDVHTFSAAVQNAADSGLTWAVNGVVGGDGMTAHGIITATGAYTAPAWIPSDRIMVTATSRQDPSKSASATVTLRWYVASVSVSPASATVKTGEQLRIDGNVSCKGPSALTWTINGINVGSPQLGVLTTSNWGNSISYIAPAAKPGVPILVTATSIANPAKSASATITVMDSDPSDPALSISPSAPSVELGATQQFTATAVNNIDPPAWSVALGANQQMNGFQVSKLITGFFNSSGMYTAPYELPPDKVVVTAHVLYPAEKYAYAIVEVKPPAVSPNTRINGSYVVQLSDSQHMTHLLGLVAADGNGHLSGTVDVNTLSGPLPPQSFSGTYSLGADGRGSATVSYTPIPGTTVPLTLRLMMQSDALAFLYTNDTYLGQTTGTLEKQAAASYAKTMFSSNFVFLLRGRDVTTGANPPVSLSSAAMASAGILTDDGSGGLTGTAEEQGAISPPTSLAGSSYTLGTDGRGTITLNLAGGGSAHFNFIMVSPQKFYLMSTDPVTAPNSNPALLIGTAEQQQGGPFGLTSLAGSFAFYDHGQNWAQLGRFESDGAGSLINGLMDYRDWGGGSISVSPYVGADFTGSYSVASNGRGTVSLSGANLSPESGAFYMISATKFILLFPMGKTAAAGEGYMQQNLAGFDWYAQTARYAAQFLGPIYPGLGWMSPPAGWLGWIDSGSSVRNETSFNFYGMPPDVDGTGHVDVLSGSGINMPMMRYYMVSGTQAFGMNTSGSLEPDDFLILRKIE